MTDYFALLEQPRQPWLDRDEIKNRYQALAKAKHPDQTDAGSSDHALAELVEANRVLADDKLRLQHLLQLEGVDPSREKMVPPRLLDLFSAVGEFMARSEHLERRLAQATNPLSKSILQSELAGCRNDAALLIDRTRALVSQAQAECRSLNESWRGQWPKLTELYLLFAFLTKWLAQLEERKFRLESS